MGDGARLVDWRSTLNPYWKPSRCSHWEWRQKWDSHLQLSTKEERKPPMIWHYYFQHTNPSIISTVLVLVVDRLDARLECFMLAANIDESIVQMQPPCKAAGKLDVRRLRADGINCLVRSTEPHEMAAAFWLSLTIWAYDASQLRLLQKSFWRCENKSWRPFCFKRAKRSSAYAMPFRMPPGLARTSCGHQRAPTSLALVAKDTPWSRPSPLGDHVVEAKRQMKDAGSLYERRFKLGAWSADAMAQLIRSGCRDYPKTLVLWGVPNRPDGPYGVPSITLSMQHARRCTVELVRHPKDVAAALVCLVCLVGHRRSTPERSPTLFLFSPLTWEFTSRIVSPLSKFKGIIDRVLPARPLPYIVCTTQGAGEKDPQKALIRTG